MNRGDLVRFFEEVMTTSAQSLKEDQKLSAGTNLVKSFIIETNRELEDSLDEISKEIKIEVKDTSDRTLTLLTLSHKKNRKKKAKYLLDSAHKRFWVFHTFEKSDTSRYLMHHLISSSLSRLDYIWLSRDFLLNFIHNKSMSEFSAGFMTDIPDYLSDEEYISRMSIRVWGTASRRALTTLRESDLHSTVALRSVRARFLLNEDENELYADERLTYSGLLSASGNSSVIHFQTIANVIRHYDQTLSLIEKDLDNAKSLRDTSPQHLQITSKIDNVKDFVEIIYTNMHNLRIYGIPRKISSNYYKIPAIDLHNGDKLDLEIFSDGIRVFLWPESCGNTLLRLETRLQRYVNADVIRSVTNDT